MKYVKPFIAGIVLLVIAITMIGALAGTVDDTSSSINISNRCEAAGCVYDVYNTTYECRNATAVDNTTCADVNAGRVLPLEGLFNTGGVVILLFIAAGLIVVVGIAMGLKKK